MRHRLFFSGAKIVVGLSGGPDSICLLDVLCKLRKKYKLGIVVAHVNYNLRGKDSQSDEKLVRNSAWKYSLPLEVLDYKADKKSANLEEKLRQIRYDFFENARKIHKANAIAVGHNLNDQAETVIMRVIRGSGLRGLGAIKFKNGYIIRPLLDISRREILEHLKKEKISYRIDRTNLGADFFRNKIRNKLIPYLEKNFNPNVQESMYKLSQTAAEDYDFIKRYSAEWIKGKKYLSVRELGSLHPSIQREVIRLAIGVHVPGLREIEAGHIEEILKIIESRKGKIQKISLKNLKIIRRGDRLTIEK